MELVLTKLCSFDIGSLPWGWATTAVINGRGVEMSNEQGKLTKYLLGELLTTHHYI